MSNKESTWFRLDNAGKLYPAIASARVSTLFRISCTLESMVNPILLQKALDNIIVRFPYFNVNLHRGFFWYYFKKSKSNPKIEKERYYPCMNLDFKDKHCFPFRVLYFNKKISVEFSHSITDGNGALMLLRSLVVEYFKLSGIEISDTLDIFTPDDNPDTKEFEDSFSKHYNRSFPDSLSKSNAYQFPFELDQKGLYHVVTGIVPVKDLLKISKEYNASLTEYLCALYFETILDFIKSLPKKKKLDPVVLNVPVNLRPIYNSITMRNFFMSLTPSIDPRLGAYTFDEILTHIKHYMKLYTNKKHMDCHIKSTVKNEKSIFVRLVPLFVKNMVLPYFYKRRGESCYTSSLSNMGKVTMPSEIADKIESFEAYPPPSKGNFIKLAIISYGDKIYLSFGKLTSNTEIEKIFFRKIRKLGIHVKIETNERWL